MKFDELIARQRSLNDLLGSYPETQELLSFALIDEAGKVSRSLYKNWRWWKWGGQDYNFCRVQLVESLSGVLKYLLVGVGAFADTDEMESAIAIWDNWDEPEYETECEFEDIGYLLAQLTIDVVIDAADYAVHTLIQICQVLEVSRDELEAVYLKKWESAKQRIEGDKEAAQ